VLKRHIGNTKGVKWNIILFYFQVIEGIKTLKIESIGYNVEGSLGSIGRTLGDVGKAPKKLFS